MRPNWKPIAAAFLVGAVIGVLAGACFQRIAWHRSWQHGADTQHILDRFTKELSLDAAQQESVKKVVEKYRADTKSLEAATSERFDRLRAASRAELAKLLRPDQQAKFKAMTERWDARRRKLGHESRFH